MTDICERGQEREQEMRQDSLDKWRRLAQPAAGDSALDCAMCGEPIPQARREAQLGTQTCIECQRDIERLGLGTPGVAK